MKRCIEEGVPQGVLHLMKTMTACRWQQQEQQQHTDNSFGPMKRLVVPNTTARSTSEPNTSALDL